jgi:hypothetical protein
MVVEAWKRWSFIIKNIYRIERSCEWIRWQRYDEGDESNINK